jgi:hypothetical protein
MGGAGRVDVGDTVGKGVPGLHLGFEDGVLSCPEPVAGLGDPLAFLSLFVEQTVLDVADGPVLVDVVVLCVRVRGFGLVDDGRERGLVGLTCRAARASSIASQARSSASRAAFWRWRVVSISLARATSGEAFHF